jgi:hypothetical protein
LTEVRAPPDVGTDKWHECRLHQIGKALLEPAAAAFQACAKRDVGKYNPCEYRQRRSDSRHCYERDALVSTGLLAYLAGARLHKVKTRW